MIHFLRSPIGLSTGLEIVPQHIPPYRSNLMAWLKPDDREELCMEALINAAETRGDRQAVRRLTRINRRPLRRRILVRNTFPRMDEWGDGEFLDRLIEALKNIDWEALIALIIKIISLFGGL